MKSIFALLGLTKYALANIYMSRNERRRVHWSGRKISPATILPAIGSALASAAVALASDLRAIGVLCAIGMRNLLHDARAALAGKRPQD
jgi:hypothetical protein